MYPDNNFLLKPSMEKVLDLANYLLDFEPKEQNDWKVINEKPSLLLHPLVLKKYFPSANFDTGQYNSTDTQYVFNPKISEYRDVILERLFNNQMPLPYSQKIFPYRGFLLSDSETLKDFAESCDEKNEPWKFYSQYSPFILQLNRKLESPISYFSFFLGDSCHIYNHMRGVTTQKQREYDFEQNLEIQISSFVISFEYDEEIKHWEPEPYLNHSSINDLHNKFQEILSIKLVRKLHTFDDNYL